MNSCESFNEQAVDREDGDDVEINDFDLLMEICTAGFGDMLHDKERNIKYYQAIKESINTMHSMGKEVHVLDIGTGTGLLSMMAVISGANSVVACEAFKPMADCAEEVFKANKMADKVKLVKKRSTELKIGPEADMPRKANLLVAELLDTELIGEGAIGIYNHAHKELLTTDVICIPSKAKCYVQVVDSLLSSQWNTFKSLANLDGNVLLNATKSIRTCMNNNMVHYVQLSQISRKQFRPLSAALEIFEFDFGNRLETYRSKYIDVVAENAGTANLIFFWWDIKFNNIGKIQLSCAPWWQHPDCLKLSPICEVENLWNLIPWRDHWMQAIYYIPKSLNILKPMEKFFLSANHDEFSFWFECLPEGKPLIMPSKKVFCTCFLHQTYSRSRIGQMNQSFRNKAFLCYLEEQVTSNSKILVLGECCVLGLATGALGAQKIIFLEPNPLSRNFMKSLANFNQINNVKFIESIKELTEEELRELSHIFGEPYFLNSIFPWDNHLNFGSLVSQIQPHLQANIQIAPYKTRIMCVPVEFINLQKMTQAIKTCEGFDVSSFDKMILQARKATNLSFIESYPLWEYPGKALAKPKSIFQSNYQHFLKKSSSFGTLKIEENGNCNGVALWCLNYITDDIQISTGNIQPIQPGAFIQWDMFNQQGVHLMEEDVQVQKESHILEYEVEFHPDTYKFSFNFNIVLNDASIDKRIEN